MLSLYGMLECQLCCELLLLLKHSTWLSCMWKAVELSSAECLVGV